MALTTAQKVTLKAHILATGDLNTVYQNGDLSGLAALLNSLASPAFIVFKSSVQTMDIGKTINYVAYEAMTAGNISKLEGFGRLNPTAFSPARADIRSFFQNVFSGALGGEGQNTRDAMEALYRRSATRTEKLFATGTGSTADPAALVFEGNVSVNELIGL